MKQNALSFEQEDKCYKSLVDMLHEHGVAAKIAEVGTTDFLNVEWNSGRLKFFNSRIGNIFLDVVNALIFFNGQSQQMSAELADAFRTAEGQAVRVYLQFFSTHQ